MAAVITRSERDYIEKMKLDVDKVVDGLMELHGIIAPWLGVIAAGTLIVVIGSVAFRGTSNELPLKRIASMLVAVGIWASAGLIAGALLGTGSTGFDILAR